MIAPPDWTVVDRYCLDGEDDVPPRLVRSWSAHSGAITDLRWAVHCYKAHLLRVLTQRSFVRV